MRHHPIYAALLRLYPRAVREEHGEEMMRLFIERLHDERPRGRIAVAAFWGRTVVDVAVNSLADRLQGGFSMDAFFADLRFAARSLLRRPGFLAVAVLTLALGVAANSAIFGVVNHTLLQPLPYPDGDQLVFVRTRTAQQPAMAGSYAELQDWRKGTTALTGLSGWRGQSVNLTGGGEPARERGAFVTSDFLGVLGAELILGRGFRAGEAELGTAQPVTVISDALWQRRFAGATDVIGKTITLNGNPRTIIGVARVGGGVDTLLGYFDAVDVYLPMPDFPNPGGLDRGRAELFVVGKLRPGASAELADAELAAISARLNKEYPLEEGGRTAYVYPLREVLVGPVRPALLLLFGAVGIVLLVSCVNVANLVLARSAQRTRELAVRSALGAGRGRLLRQLLTENFLLGALGGAVGLALSVWFVRALVAFSPPDLGISPDTAIDLSVFAYTLAISFASGLVFGLVPALRASRADAGGLLHSSASGAVRQRFRDGLVVAEVALSLVLLVGAGLLLRSAAARASADPGFRGDHLLTAALRLPAGKYAADEQIATFYRTLVDRLEGQPGVESAALARALPFGGNEARIGAWADGQPEPAPGAETVVQVNVVSPGFFHTLGIPLLDGRVLAASDTRAGERVVVVSQRLAHALFGDAAIGHRIHVRDAGLATIVGVVGEVHQVSFDEAPLPQVWFAQEQRPMIYGEIAVRTAGDPAAFASTLRATLWSIDADQPIWAVRTMDTLLDRARGPARALGYLVTLFAAVAVALAAVGLYGVMATAVTQRTREIGIRMALGAEAQRVVRDVVGRGLALAAIAVVLGLAGALALGRVLESLLFDVATTDLVTLVSAPLLLLAVSGLAAYIPARRAARIDPALILKE